EALHQLVGDVIILREELAGDIEGDAVRPVFGNALPDFRRYLVQRPIPIDPIVADHRMEQPSFEPHRLSKPGAFGTQLSEIRRVVLVAGDVERTIASDFSGNSASHTAIGASGPDARHSASQAAICLA